ncbi:MAG: DegV family protein [Caldilineales bacterium]|nr:DegV family protein [Caldilineales bacterium]
MIRIVTDTTAGLPDDLARRHAIPVAPQIVVFGNEEFQELQDLSNEEFMRKLATSANLPKTAAPSPATMADIYRPFVEVGDAVLSIHPSSEISGTVRSGSVAAQSFPDADIRVIDTRSIAGPLSRMVLQAAALAESGSDADAIIAHVHDLMARSRIYFLVDTLEYLQKGGRIGGAQALLGSLLQVKPILTLQDGRVEAFERQRTQKRARARLLEIVESESARGDEALLTVMHAGLPDVAAEIASALKQTLQTEDVLICELGPAIITHAGPGALAVGFFTAGKS